MDNVMPEVKAKKIYEVGEIPQLGQVPEKMYAWTIRRERHGVPEKSFQIEQVDTCLLYTSPSPRDLWISRMPSSA